MQGVRFQYLPMVVVDIGCEVSVPAEECVHRAD